ncbi:AAA family ATPase [Clostridium beijerinckii]|uniref:AAA family ATPase n=1 Tax=Clostridium beijerinckii TaxID=1520 RepID=UPI0022271A4F|nr:AAA family ATPase [Clostridium beijerinckii]UYZ36767.1 AAA family ATPase [Clostridium beijerinckii]
MKLEVIKISAVGFKGYKDNVGYTLGYRTLILGDNGLGKSTVGEEIAWALTGCNIWGNERATTDLVNNNKPKLTEVVLDFLLDGEPQTIIRRKKGSSNEVYWNDQRVTTNDIARDIFKNKDVFLSILNPYYFPNLAPKDAKQLLSDVLKPANREEILNELGYLKQVLLDNGFRMPETFLSDARTDLKEHEDNLIFLEGRKSTFVPVEVGEKKTFDDTELKKLRKQLDKIKNSSNLESELLKLEKPQQSTAELMELNTQEATLKSSINNSIPLQELLNVNYKKSRKDELLAEYKSKKKRLDDMESKIVKCDNCGNEIDLTKEAKEMLKKELEDIKEYGLNLAAEIKDIETKNAEVEEKNKKIESANKAKQNEINLELDKIAVKKSEILAKDEIAKKEYEAKKQFILDKHKVAKVEINEKVNFLKAQISAIEAEEREVISFNASIDAAIKQNERIAEDQEQNTIDIRNSKNKIEQLKLAIDAAKQYNSIKLKKQSEQIKPYLDKVEIQFEKITKDGELKEDFKIVYDGKEFNKLSASEKIKAGLEIANLLINIQNLHFPIFVDDSESINVVPELDTQMIKARVTLDKEVKVEVLE